ncbi:hypothetical protein CEP88_00035 (plasmid) [Roseobacter denitrificans]|nr:hypothetical protein CEP88_00035 [Roseobacter denitrificans]SFG41185.1 hypothetical protein SAMN05443635_11658 [Roseobacter denitrificans OCh 114]
MALPIEPSFSVDFAPKLPLFLESFAQFAPLSIPLNSHGFYPIQHGTEAFFDAFLTSLRRHRLLQPLPLLLALDKDQQMSLRSQMFCQTSIFG